MIEFIYDFCLLYKNDCDERFEIVELQTNNILILKNDQFAAIENKQLIAAKLLSKIREK